MTLIPNYAYGQHPTLVQQIDAALHVPELQSGFQGVVVLSLTDNTVLYERNADKVFLPASNNKLLTSAVALEALGPDFVYHTRLYRTGVLDPDGTLHGDLYLQGNGDPVLTPDDINFLAGAAFDAGIRRITGGIHYDDTLFDRQYLGEGWAWDDEPFYYSAQISALNVNENLININLQPAKTIGDKVALAIAPTQRYANVICTAVTIAAGTPKSITVDRVRGTNEIHIGGTIPIDIAPHDNKPLDVTIENPARFTTSLLIEALQKKQVLLNSLEPVDGPPTPGDAIVVSEHASLPLAGLLKRLNKPSDNLIAECLLKTIGAVKQGHGTGGPNGTGAQSARSILLHIGLDSTQFLQVDGSGLARTNYISPRNIALLLAYLHKSTQFLPFYDSLPIAAVDGTLRGRMKNSLAANNCHAKTGTESHVSCLSGYVTTRDGEMLAFSILMNNHQALNSVCTAVQDKIVDILAAYSRKITADHNSVHGVAQ